jgi:hypothetical protein
VRERGRGRGRGRGRKRIYRIFSFALALVASFLDFLSFVPLLAKLARKHLVSKKS